MESPELDILEMGHKAYAEGKIQNRINNKK